MINIKNERRRAFLDEHIVTVKLPSDPAPPHFVSLDVETAQHHMAICQIGIVEVLDGKVIRRKSFLIQPPNNEYDYYCLRIHGITPSMTKNAPTFPEIWPELKSIIEGQVVVCHNASFDIGSLDNDIDYYNLGELDLDMAICTCTELGRMDLYSCCVYFGVELDGHHNAAADAEATAMLFLAYSKRAGEVVTICKAKEKKISLAQRLSEVTVTDSADKLPLLGKTIVLTGIFEHWIQRSELAVKLTELGAKVTTSISRNTDFLVTGEFPGDSKIALAQKIRDAGGKIQIISEDELMAMF